MYTVCNVRYITLIYKMYCITQLYTHSTSIYIKKMRFCEDKSEIVFARALIYVIRFLQCGHRVFSSKIYYIFNSVLKYINLNAYNTYKI